MDFTVEKEVEEKGRMLSEKILCKIYKRKGL